MRELHHVEAGNHTPFQAVLSSWDETPIQGHGKVSIRIPDEIRIRNACEFSPMVKDAETIFWYNAGFARNTSPAPKKCPAGCLNRSESARNWKSIPAAEIISGPVVPAQDAHRWIVEFDRLFAGGHSYKDQPVCEFTGNTTPFPRL